jgi:hypothetical protein
VVKLELTARATREKKKSCEENDMTHPSFLPLVLKCIYSFTEHFDIITVSEEEIDSMRHKMTFLIVALLGALPLTGCKNMIHKAGREAKYSAYEMIGIQKRDLFKKQVANVKESQEETGEAFKDALDRLKEVYKFDGGNLEREYRSLDKSYERSSEKADEVRARITKLETIAQDIFDEWKKEIKEMSASSLRDKSSESLAETQKKYAIYNADLKKSERKMAPVLSKLKDQVLFLKHNLNAKAIAGLKTESGKIQGDIEDLIKEMNTSINSAEDFMKTID